MKEQLISQIIPLLITFIIGVFTVIIKAVGAALIKLIEAKRDEVIKKIGLTKYNEEKTIALDIWNIVDEHFRINQAIGDCIQLKIDMFNNLLKEKIPYLTDNDIEHLRQAIAGEVNKYKTILNTGNAE
ncbi:MAG: hypothetical protein Q8933_09300 [Bacteroidota bacterium]|nr:hypothetical protein [Bacteroidota bacterium]